MKALYLLCLLCLVADARADRALELAIAAKSQIGVTTSYDPAYVKLKYPGGDVPKETGVCSDVLVRAYRDLGIDLQKAVHEDMAKDFGAYPRKWGLKAPDSNIDHRRVANLMKFFERKGAALEISWKPSQYQPGDVVAWDLGNKILHIGIVSNRKSPVGIPLIVHNIGRGVREEDILFLFEIIGHYRYGLG